MSKTSVDTKIADLRDSLNISNIGWNAWERDFIRSMVGKQTSYLSEKELTVIDRLWDKL